MKIYLSNYRNHWFSPYKMLELIMFWKSDYDAYENEPPKFLSFISKVILKFLNFIHPEIKYIKIDNYDAWNGDHTLSLIIAPLLKEIKKDKQGAPHIDDEDVPDELKSCYAPRVENAWDIDDNFFKRWDWTIDELIWTFDQLNPNSDWESQFHSGDIDIQFVKLDDGNSEMITGPNDTHVVDYTGMTLYQNRINNGLRLFGKYYQSLWT